MRSTNFWTFFVFEDALGLAGLIGIKLSGLPLPRFWPAEAKDLLWGLGAAALTYAFWLLVLQVLPPLRRLLAPLLLQLRPMFIGARFYQLALISMAAGFGEELLFRAFLQDCTSLYLGDAWAIAIASGLFAALHFLSFAYFAISLVMGVALGIVYAVSDSLLLVAIWHGVYDLIALSVLIYRPKLLGVNS